MPALRRARVADARRARGRSGLRPGRDVRLPRKRDRAGADRAAAALQQPGPARALRVRRTRGRRPQRRPGQPGHVSRRGAGGARVRGESKRLARVHRSARVGQNTSSGGDSDASHTAGPGRLFRRRAGPARPSAVYVRAHQRAVIQRPVRAGAQHSPAGAGRARKPQQHGVGGGEAAPARQPPLQRRASDDRNGLREPRHRRPLHIEPAADAGILARPAGQAMGARGVDQGGTGRAPDAGADDLREVRRQGRQPDGQPADQSRGGPRPGPSRTTPTGGLR